MMSNRALVVIEMLAYYENKGCEVKTLAEYQ